MHWAVQAYANIAAFCHILLLWEEVGAPPHKYILTNHILTNIDEWGKMIMLNYMYGYEYIELRVNEINSYTTTSL